MTDGGNPQQVAVKALGPDMDKNKLLLLGLNLLNKSLKLPCAIVKPQAKSTSPKAPSQLAEKLKSSPSPECLKKSPVEITRKRKRDPNEDDLSELDKREKRLVVFKDI